MSAESAGQKRGHDASASSREHDHLNRWPVAQEIYGIATTGPKEWSVRVGIYGEWGTGKTSVLNFIETMAITDGNIAVRFNPWEYSDSRTLWHAFVNCIETAIQKKVPDWDPSYWRRLKKPISRFAGFLGRFGRKSKPTLYEHGIELLKDFFSYTRSDLQNILAKARPTRILILIDDLDRTSASVVPEIFFALKEVMDIPGVAFICAFDPEVVGKVLSERHPGFGDGLKFLEKIVDYPRYLPVPTTDGLVNLALSDAKETCPYVPGEALTDAIRLLPANPRAVRQFIRILALLRPQIERHYPEELHWPTILTANVLKVRHPRLAHPLLSDKPFWEAIQTEGSLGTAKADKLNETISKNVETVIKREQESTGEKEREEVKEAIKALCSRMNPWLGITAESLSYQMNVAEFPNAVTRKEFHALLASWVQKPTANTVNDWIANHAASVARLYCDVFDESFSLALQQYMEALRSVDQVLVNAERPGKQVEAESAFALLECLSYDLGQTKESDKGLNAEQFDVLLKEFASVANYTLTVAHQTFRTKEDALLIKVLGKWTTSFGPLVKVLQPFTSWFLRNNDSPAARALHKRICAEVLPKYSNEFLQQWTVPDFVNRVVTRREDGYEARYFLLKADGPFWKQNRTQALTFFRAPSTNRVVQENIFEFLHWMNCELREGRDADNAKLVQELLKDAEITSALWDALTSVPLNRRPVVWLKDFPARLLELGVTVTLPEWWKQIVASIETPKEAES